ncbi:hypothetical protein FDECE_10628 [Fusarium decemcellulare]|nr:hypothetical protein FDECE_10628 [Fusarium decemcellulare]
MADKTEDASFSHRETLGDVRLRDEKNNIILVPTPSKHPDDPLNWPKLYRYYVAGLVSLAIFLSNFVAAAPSVAIVDMATDYFGPPGPDLSGNITKVSYFITTTTLLQGVGNLIWMPLVLKFGRRPVYVVSFALFTATCFWAGATESYASTLAARIFLGFASGATECLAPLTISDIFFLHERGTIMAIYSTALSGGVGCGIVIAGLITINLHWRYIYWVSGSLVGACTLLMIFTFPETEFKRNNITDNGTDPGVADAQMDPERLQKENSRLRTYGRSLSLYSGRHTQESFWKLFVRPIILIVLPPVLWATLVMAASVGFLVAITSNYATAFSTLYNFKPWQSGLCFIASPIGALIGNIFGGYVSDRTADYSTKRNNGMREPEMRLPAIIFAVVAGPLSLALYGVGIENEYHWTVPTIGIGLSLLGFLLSFYTNPWIDADGYAAAFGAMAGIIGGIISLGFLVYAYGKRIRHDTWKWSFIENLAHWDKDREVGE